VYLVIGFSFQRIVFLVFGRLCYMRALCQVYLYVERILCFVCLLVWLGYVLYNGFKYMSCLSYVFELIFNAV
jgi:hypothetical protein